MTTAAPPAREDFRVGQILRVQDEDNWTLRVLDVRKGGFGVVYVVLDDRRSARWALKTFQSRLLWSDEDRKRFEREALTWLMLDRHPNIATAKGLLRIEGQPFIWLEYYPYTLAQALAKGPLSFNLALHYAIQFCWGMDYAHRKTGIVHRDVKPSNCLLTKDVGLKITDFGLARAFGENGGALDLRDFDPRIGSYLTGTIGTPQYMSPEQFRSGAILDTRSDIYSFGVMLHEMLAGDLPPLGYAAHSHILTYAYRHAVPEPLKQIVLCCVAMDPRERPDDFGVVGHQLEDAYLKLTGRPWVWQPNAKALEMKSSDWNDKGVGLQNLGYLEEACACFARALAAGQPEASTWMNYGGCLARLGLFDEALSCFDRALEISPHDPTVWSNKGVTLELCRRNSEARVCYERSLELDTRNAAVWMNLGGSYADAGDLERTVNCYDRSLEIDTRCFEAWSNKAAVLFRLKRYDEALQCCDRGVAIQPRNYELWNRRACALGELGRLQEALAASNRALEIEERASVSWQTKGVILGRLGRNTEAKGCLDRAQELKGGSDAFELD